MQPDSLLPLLTELLLKSTFVLLTAGLVHWLWRGASAAGRHLVWLAAFATMLLLPLTPALTPRWAWTWKAASTPAPLPASSVVVTAPLAFSANAPEAAPVARAQSLPSWRVLLGAVWMSGAVFFLGMRGVGSWQLGRLKRRSRVLQDARVSALAAECSCAKTVEFRQARECRVPLTWGLWHPVVLLPEEAKGWTEERLAAALRHEFAHIRRRDYAARTLAQFVSALYWMNPLVWLAARALRTAQEQASDDLVLSAGSDAGDYAMQLLEAARALSGAPLVGSAAVAMARPSTLEGRVRAIVDERRNRRPAGRRAVLVATLLVTAVTAASTVARLQAQSATAETQKSFGVAVGGEVKAGAVPVIASQPVVTISAKIMELPASADGVIKAAQASETLSASAFTTLIGQLTAMKGVDMLSAPRVATMSGKQASIVVGREVIVDAATAKMLVDGVTLHVTPTVAGVEVTLETELTVSARLPKAKEPLTEASFRTRKITARVKLKSGEAVVLGNAQAKGDERRLIAVLSAVVGEDAAGKPSGPAPVPMKSAADKAREIVIPKLELREATLRDAVAFLTKKSVELDEEKRGVNIVLKLPAGADPQITLSLSNIPLIEAVRYVARLSDLELTTDDAALYLHPAGE